MYLDVFNRIQFRIVKRSNSWKIPSRVSIFWDSHHAYQWLSKKKKGIRGLGMKKIFRAHHGHHLTNFANIFDRASYVFIWLLREVAQYREQRGSFKTIQKAQQAVRAVTIYDRAISLLFAWWYLCMSNTLALIIRMVEQNMAFMCVMKITGGKTEPSGWCTYIFLDFIEINKIFRCA